MVASEHVSGLHSLQHCSWASVLFDLYSVGINLLYVNVQRYDPDPMTQAAAASMMGSKLVADSGSKVCPVDETQLAEKLMEIESENPSGMRKRCGKESQNGAIKSGGASDVDHSDGSQHSEEIEVAGFMDGQLVVNHYDSASTMQDCGWIARITSLLVDEDHTESCPLICGNCRKHNGNTGNSSSLLSNNALCD